MQRENRIREYLDMIALGDCVVDGDVRKIYRKTIYQQKSSLSKEVLTFIEKETLEFT